MSVTAEYSFWSSSVFTKIFSPHNVMKRKCASYLTNCKYFEMYFWAYLTFHMLLDDDALCKFCSRQSQTQSSSLTATEATKVRKQLKTQFFFCSVLKELANSLSALLSNSRCFNGDARRQPPNTDTHRIRTTGTKPREKK